MAMIETWVNQDLTAPVQVVYLPGNVFSQDNNGNLIGVNVFQDGEPATLSGSVSASVIRADGATVAVTGSLSGNQCSVVLPQACYAVPGVLSIVIKLTGDGAVTTVGAVVANVYRSSTDTAVDPGQVIPDISALIAAIDAAVASIPLDYSNLSKSDELNGIKILDVANAYKNAPLCLFELGDISGGSDTGSAVRARTIGRIFCDSAVKIIVPYGWRAWIADYGTNNQYVGYGPWVNGPGVAYAPAGRYFRVVCATVPEGNVDVDAAKNSIRFESALIAKAEQAETNFIRCESGTYADADGKSKTANANRIRNAYPVPVDDKYSVTIPSGYEAWIFRLDVNGDLISPVGSWRTGTLLIRNIITSDTKYINMAFKNTSTPSSDISGQVGTVEAGIVITSCGDMVPGVLYENNAAKERIVSLEDYAFIYDDITGDYQISVGQAYGYEGSQIIISASDVYRHVKIMKSDDVGKVIFNTANNYISSYIQYVDDDDIVIARAFIAGTYDYLKTYEYIPWFPDGATGMYVTAANVGQGYTLKVLKKSEMTISKTVEGLQYDNIVKSVCRIADGLPVPHQSIIGYKTAYKNGFRAMLCDLRFTSDNVPVLEHDAKLNENYSDVYDSEGVLVPTTPGVYIAQTTYEDLLDYDFGLYKGSAFAGTKIMTFEQMLNLCKCLGCEVHIEQKVSMTEQQYGIVFGLIRAYGMEQKCVWNPQTVSDMQALIAYEPDVYINLHTNLSSGSSLSDNTVNAIIAAVNDYNRGHVSLTLTLGAIMTQEQASALSAAGVGIMGTTLNSPAQVLQYYNQGKPYTSLTSVLSDTVIAGKILFDNIMNG